MRFRLPLASALAFLCMAASASAVQVAHERVVGGLDASAPITVRWWTTRTADVPPTAAPTAAAGGYSIPAYIVSCESGGDYSAENPSSGAVGAYQILPSTAAAYGCDLSTRGGQDRCAARIYADVGSSAWSCG